MRKLKTIVLTGIAFSAIVLSATAQLPKKGGASDKKGKHHIEIKINGLKDSKLMLGYYFDTSKYVMDTVPVNKDGVAVFKGDSLIYPGVYIAILPDLTNFDFLIDRNSQEFKVETSKSDLWGGLKFANSAVNSNFLDYQKYMKSKQEEVTSIQQKYKDRMSDPEAQRLMSEELKKVDRDVKSKWEEIRTTEKGSMLSVLVSLVQSPNIPDFNIPENTPKRDSIRWARGYNYQKNHYWDNIDLNDSRLLRTPIFASRLKNYFTNILIQAPDSLKPEVERFIAKTAANKDVYQYCISYLLNHFNKSNIMSHDDVFVFIAEKYYLSGKAPWANKELIDKLQDRVTKLKPNLIGKIAPNLVMESETGEYYALEQVKAKYTVLYFWEPDCSHCMKETPKLYELYNKVKDKGVKVYAVCTQYKKDEWTKAIAEKGYDWINVWDANYNSNFRSLYDITSTPTLYLLDKDKKILAKRISVETLEQILNEINK